MARIKSIVGAALGIAAILGVPAGAQLAFAFGVPRADSLLSRGLVTRAESAYYAAADAHPRDPVSRAALGRFLAARGAVPVGVVLLEEARTFGGDPARIARDLAPLYEQIGDFATLAKLPSSPLSPAARARVAWLVSAASAAQLPDISTVRYRPGADSWSVGTITVRIDGDAISNAILDPDDTRIVIDSHAALAQRLRTFHEGTSAERATLAVADSLAIGDAMFTNIPVTIAPLSHGATVSVGLAFLAQYAPTFDPEQRSITLRASGTVPRESQEVRIPLLMTAQGPRVLIAGRWVSLSAPELRAARDAHRLTIDLRRGELAISR